MGFGAPMILGGCSGPIAGHNMGDFLTMETLYDGRLNIVVCHVYQLSNILRRLLSLMSDKDPSKILMYLFLSLVFY